MNKKNIIIISAAVLVLALATAGVFYAIKNNQSKKAKPAERQEQKAGEKNLAAPAAVPLTKEQYENQAQTVTVQKQTTLAEISSLVQNNDLSGCAELAEDYKRICLNNVYFNLAKSSLDKKDCDNISAPELKVSCYAEVDKGLVIKKQQNISNAEKTEEENFRKNDAYQKITAYKDGKTAIPEIVYVDFMKLIFNYRNEKYCSELPAYKVTECVNLFRLDLARQSLDLTACQKIQDDYWQNKCVNDITIKKAHKELNPNLCQALTGENKQECLAGL